MQKSTSHSLEGRYRRMVLALVADSTITSFAPGFIAPIPSSSAAAWLRRLDAVPTRFLAPPAAAPLALERAVVVAARAVSGSSCWYGCGLLCRRQGGSSSGLLPLTPMRRPRRWERGRSMGLVVVVVGGWKAATAAARHDSSRRGSAAGGDGRPILPCRGCRRRLSLWPLPLLLLLLRLVEGLSGEGEAAASDRQ